MFTRTSPSRSYPCCLELSPLVICRTSPVLCKRNGFDVHEVSWAGGIRRHDEYFFFEIPTSVVLRRLRRNVVRQSCASARLHFWQLSKKKIVRTNQNIHYITHANMPTRDHWRHTRNIKRLHISREHVDIDSINLNTHSWFKIAAKVLLWQV